MKILEYIRHRCDISRENFVTRNTEITNLVTRLKVSNLSPEDIELISSKFELDIKILKDKCSTYIELYRIFSECVDRYKESSKSFNDYEKYYETMEDKFKDLEIYYNLNSIDITNNRYDEIINESKKIMDILNNNVVDVSDKIEEIQKRESRDDDTPFLFSFPSKDILLKNSYLRDTKLAHGDKYEYDLENLDDTYLTEIKIINKETQEESTVIAWDHLYKDPDSKLIK